MAARRFHVEVTCGFSFDRGANNLGLYRPALACILILFFSTCPLIQLRRRRQREYESRLTPRATALQCLEAVEAWTL